MMNLIKLKIRGLGATPETQWLDVGSGHTLFHLPDRETALALIKAMQTINPPYRCRTQKPYAKMPTTIRDKGYARIIKPHKRTVALAVFSSTPQLVEQLAACSPLFYETDRIEVGRRLDYTRWISFIELASSTRWSEISEQIKELYENWGSHMSGAEQHRLLMEQLLPTDRIENVVMDQLDHLLCELRSSVPENCQELLHDLISTVRRSRHFSMGREIIKKRLPFFFIIDPCQPPIDRVEITDVTPADGDLQPVEFLLNRLHRSSAGKTGVSDLGPRRLDAVNRELSRLQSKQLVRFEENDGTYRIEGGYRNRDMSDADPITSSRSLKEHCHLIIASAKVLTGSPPILLFHQTADSFDTASGKNISSVITELAPHCQCLAIMQGEGSQQLKAEAVCHHFTDFLLKRDVPQASGTPRCSDRG